MNINPCIWGVFFSILLVLTGCNTLHQPQLSSLPVRLPQTESHVTLKDKDVLYALMLSAGLSMDIDPHCKGAGREISDRTLGEYLSGFLADLSDFEAKNKIEVNSFNDFDANYGAVWRVRLLITQNYEEVFWSAGLDFLINKESRAVIPESVRCIGAG